MTRGQISDARKLIGKMSREDIASELGVSVPNLKRAFRGTRLAFFNKHAANPKRVAKVARFYERHGLAATERAFPDVRVRSIVERYKIYRPRQVRWKDSEIILAAKMAGLVDEKKQAKIFNRPNANEGSIKSLWHKRFKLSAEGQIHGMPHFKARHIVADSCPFLKVKFFKLCLWVDMEKHLLKGNPAFVRDGVKAMAEFQRWLFDSKNPRREIIRLSGLRG